MNEHIRSPGVDLIKAEMARQHDDAVQTYGTVAEMAAEIAEAIKINGRLALIGMGGSHWLNRIACPHYVNAGIDATCHVASEYIRAPISSSKVILLASQSGRSGEIVRLIELGLAKEPSFGLTLEGSGTLAQKLPSLVGSGGSEKAYAATRSLLVTLAMHAAILNNIDKRYTIRPPSDGFKPDRHEYLQIVERLSEAKNSVFVARGMDQGIMDAAALSFMEIARIPVLGLEAGQFRHGPFEMVDANSSVVFLRSKGKKEDDLRFLVQECIDNAIIPVVFDASGDEAIEGAITLQLPPASGLELAFTALPLIQEAITDASDRMVMEAGVPQRSSKVSSAEVS